MSCEEVLALLEEGTTNQEVMAHLATCQACAAHAALLAQLRGLAPAAGERKPGWVWQLPHPSWLWRKPGTYLPLVLGLGSLALGLSFFGFGAGLPARDELDVLARAFWEVTGFAVGEALFAACRQVSNAWGPGLAVAMLVLGVSGVLLLRWVGSKVRA